MNFCCTLVIYCNWQKKRKIWLPDLMSCLKEGEYDTKLQKLIYKKPRIKRTEAIVENNVNLFAILVTFGQEKWIYMWSCTGRIEHFSCDSNVK